MIEADVLRAATTATTSSLLALECDEEAAIAAMSGAHEALATRIALHIGTLVPQGRSRCLAVGRGCAMLVDAICARAPHSDWYRADTLTGGALTYADSEFDVALLCDVLHEEHEGAARLLCEARRVARCVLVKDHFDDGMGTRPVTSLVGSSSRGVRRGRECFTREGFVRLATQQRLFLAALDSNFDRDADSRFVGAPLQPDSQFIAVLRA